MEYLPLYRIKGGTLKCDGEKCRRIMDTNVAHLYLFYILEGDNKVGIIFEYHATSTESVAATSCPNPYSPVGVCPVISTGKSTTTHSLLIKMMTIDPVQVVKDFHRSLIISADDSFKRRALNWYRRHQRLYTKESEPIRNLDDTRIETNDGIFCVPCMKNKHGNHYENVVFQFNGWAQFIE